jgi:hypothetical protein
MNTIYKYTISRSGVVEMPVGAKILHVGCQGSEIMLWAEVDTGNANENRLFEVFGTGFQIPIDIGVSRKYLATVFVGSFVWHVYEKS